MNKMTWATVAMAGAVMAAAPASAQADAAQAGTGPYVSISVGAAVTRDVALDYSDEGGTFGGTGATDTLATRADLRTAFDVNGAVGYDFGAVRAEVQVDYSRSRIRALNVRSLNGSAVTALDGEDVADFCAFEEIDGCSVSGNRLRFDGPRLRQLSALANLWYDIPVGTVVTPYVGGGVGVGGFEVEGEGKARFAWQVGAGVAYNLSPSVAITADYRYRSIGGATFRDDDFPESAFRVGKVRTNLFTAGLRFTF